MFDWITLRETSAHSDSRSHLWWFTAVTCFQARAEPIVPGKLWWKRQREKQSCSYCSYCSAEIYYFVRWLQRRRTDETQSCCITAASSGCVLYYTLIWMTPGATNDVMPSSVAVWEQHGCLSVTSRHSFDIFQNLHMTSIHLCFQHVIVQFSMISMIFPDLFFFLNFFFFFSRTMCVICSSSDGWRLPDPTSCSFCPLLQGPHLLWLLWGDAVGSGAAGAQMWRLDTQAGTFHSHMV